VLAIRPRCCLIWFCVASRIVVSAASASASFDYSISHRSRHHNASRLRNTFETSGDVDRRPEPYKVAP
jgi:hypothetical protein